MNVCLFVCFYVYRRLNRFFLKNSQYLPVCLKGELYAAFYVEISNERCATPTYTTLSTAVS